MFYRHTLRPLLFARDPEAAHEQAIGLLARVGTLPAAAGHRPRTHARLRVELAGLSFPNPVGLAAGCDKNARAVAVWPHFGFGFVEAGTVTGQPQPGNPKPRVFRVPEQDGLVNRLGFNSEGSEAVALRLAHLRRQKRCLPVPLGINIGKTKAVAGDEAVLKDYRLSFRRLSRYADFVVVNVSSPNTPGLRQWQERERLELLLTALQEESALLAADRGLAPVPLFVKISPDMSEAELDDVIEVALQQKLAGIVATNTTLAREGGSAGLQQDGGLSGRPLAQRALRVLRYLFRQTQGRLPLIGVGGIFSADDAYARIQAGASLVQLYTAMVYEGPYLPRRIVDGLLRRMEADGVRHISELVGTDTG